MAIRKGTGFTNLNRVLQASRGNRLGQTISGGIQEQAAGVKTQVKSAQEQFEEEAKKGRLDTGEAAQKRSDILGRFAPSSGAGAVQQQPVTPQAQQPATQTGTTAGGFERTTFQTGAGTQQATPQAGTQPTPAQSPVSEQEIQDFTKFRTGIYTGPKQLQDLQTLYGRAGQAEQLGGLARSEGGRQELLRRFVGGTGYTPGQRQLDTTLLGQQPGQLGQAAREARGATGLVERAAGTAAGLAQEYTGRAKAFGEETQRMVGETREPLSQALEQRVTAAQQAEEKRKKAFQDIQKMITGADEKFAGLDRLARVGLGVQKMADLGYLSPTDLTQLVAQDGLIRRAEELGLDTSKLVGERLQDIIAQNLGRGGIATEEERAQLTALERLAGEQGADLEFGQPGQAFQAGRIGLDLAGLDDYITKTEQERAARDAAYAEKLARERARYLNQAKAYTGQALGSSIGALGNMTGTASGLAGTGVLGAGAGLGAYGAASVGGGLGAGALAGAKFVSPYALAAMLGTDVLTGGDTTAQTAQQLGQTGLGAVGATGQTMAAGLEGLLKLNIGGQSLANTQAGRQLLKAVDFYSSSLNRGIGEGGKIVKDVTEGLGDITSGRDIFGGIEGIIGGSVGRIGGGLAKNIGGAVKRIVPKGIKISDEDLKTDIDYSPEDLQRFMDRIKPAAYNYKDEVKDSPLASKNRELGVMAQDLEKSKLGKEAVKDTEMGKVVDYDNLEPKMLASIAALNKRLKELEEKK